MGKPWNLAKAKAEEFGTDQLHWLIAIGLGWVPSPWPGLWLSGGVRVRAEFSTSLDRAFQLQNMLVERGLGLEYELATLTAAGYTFATFAGDGGASLIGGSILPLLRLTAYQRTVAAVIALARAGRIQETDLCPR